MENCGRFVFYNNICFSLVVASRPPPTTRSDFFLVVFFYILLLYLCSFKHQLTHRKFSSYVKIFVKILNLC